MDKEIAEVIRSAVKEAVKEEIDGLMEVVTDGFGYLNDKIDKTNERLGAIEAQIRTAKLDIETLKMDATTIKRETAGVRLELDEARPEIHETRTAVLRIEHTLQDKQEAQGDEIRYAQQRIERIESRLNLPHSLSAA